MLLLGGLDAANRSRSAILTVTTSGGRPVGVLPVAIHDSAAVSLGGATYLFGGGTNANTQSDAIVRVSTGGRTATVVGHLPAPSSDQAAATVGDTAYVVGGYTGSRWLNTIVAWRPGEPARVVARLPFPLRYAAVTPAGGRLLIAGGSLENGTASRAVLVYAPGSGVRRLGALPVPTTHAAAAALGDVVYVIGGRGADATSQTRRVVAIDVRTGRIRNGGSLTAPRSDLAAISVGGKIVLVGGRSAGATQSTISTLVPKTPSAAGTAQAETSAAGIYAADGADELTGAARRARALVYVPNSQSGTVDVIDPRTGKPGRTIGVEDPYNMYFTPGGRYAIVVAERLHRLDFRDAHTLRLHRSLVVPCAGVDHMDFSADGSYLLASCEFSGQMVKVDVASERVVATLRLPDGASGMPQDVRLSPDGRIFYVADLQAGGVWEIDGARMKVTGFVATGRDAHGLYPSRNGRLLYVSNRGAGSVSVLDFASRKVVATWRIPGGGSPDMGGVSADGSVLWLSGRYNGVVYAISTRTGKLLARIAVGSGPHGVCVWPQPGRYSLGHTGNMR